MEEGGSFAPLLLVVFLAFVVPLLLSRFKRLRLPVVVGEILAGILIGGSVLGWVDNHDAILDLLAEFGFVFLMFLSGMEIDFSSVGEIGQKGERTQNSKSKKINFWSPVSLGIVGFLFTLGMSISLGYGMVFLGLARSPWMLALILSTTSLGVVLPVLKERGLSSGRYGQAILIAALIADFATMLLITILVAEASQGLTLVILRLCELFVAFFLIYRVGFLFFNQLGIVRRAMEEITHATTQIKVRAAFTMMLIFVVLSEMLGTEIILGAFLAGAVISLLRTSEDAELTSQLEAIGFGFFIPIFFIKVGIDFNLAALLTSPQSLLLVPLLLISALLVKIAPMLLFRHVYPWRETIAAGTLLSARLSLIIAASAIGLQLGLIGESVNAAIILVAIISVTIAPLIFLRILPEQLGDKLRPIVVAGAGELGLEVAKGLLAHHELVTLVDDDEVRAERARQRGLNVLNGRIEQPNQKIAEILDQAETLVCTHNDTEVNYQICQHARSVFGIDHVVAQVNSPNDIIRFEQIGVSTLNVALDRATMLVMLARNPAVYSLLNRTDDDKEVTEVVVQNPDCFDKAMHQISLPGDLLILALRRNGELLVPHGDTRIQAGDHLTMVGSLEFVEFGRQFFTHEEKQLDLPASQPVPKASPSAVDLN